MNLSINEEAKKTAEIIKQGGIILFASETCWNLACDATHNNSILKIQKILNSFEPQNLTILLQNEIKLNYYVKDIPPLAYDLFDLNTQAIVIIYPELKNLAPYIIQNQHFIGVKITKHEFSTKLLEKCGKAIVVLPIFYSEKAYSNSLSKIDSSILTSVDYVVNLGQNMPNTFHPEPLMALGMKGEIKLIRK